MSRSRDTADTFVEQDQLARTYEGPNDPHMTADKERLGDTWITPATDDADVKPLANKISDGEQAEPKRLPAKKKRSLSKFTRYYHKREY